MIDVTEKALGIRFGFSREILQSLGNEEIITIAIDRAKQGIRGGIQVRRGEVKKRIEADMGYITLSNLGMEGVKGERMGVIVEFVNEIMVGKVEGHGISVYDWCKVKKEL